MTDNAKALKSSASGFDRMRYSLGLFMITMFANMIVYAICTFKKTPENIAIVQYYQVNIGFLAWHYMWLCRFPFSLFNRVVVPGFEYVFPTRTGVYGSATKWLFGASVKPDDPELKVILNNAAVFVGLCLALFSYFLLPVEKPVEFISNGIESSFSQTAWFWMKWKRAQWAEDHWVVFTAARGIGFFLIIWFTFTDYVRWALMRADVGGRWLRKKLEEVRNWNYIFTKLPEAPFDPRSPEFNLSFFTYLPNGEGSERFFRISERAATTSMIVFAPPGKGKTQGFIFPAMTQAISWQADNPDLKACGIVFDPKGELTRFAIDTLTRSNRKEDILHIRVGQECNLNPILTEHPLKGTQAEAAVSYIMAAYINVNGASKEPYWNTTAQALMTIAYLISACENNGWTSLSIMSQMLDEFSVGLKGQNQDTDEGAPSHVISVDFAERWYALQMLVDAELDMANIFKYLPPEINQEMFYRRIVNRSRKFYEYFTGTLNTEERLDGAKVLMRAISTFLNSYEKINPVNRSQAISNVVPFLSLFRNPAVERALCGRKAFDVDTALATGKWLICDIPEGFGINVVKACTTLLKIRFQKAVLNGYSRWREKLDTLEFDLRHAKENENQAEADHIEAAISLQKTKLRFTTMILEECHHTVTFGAASAGVQGDSEFYDRCRSARCFSLLVTQNVSGLYNAAGGNRDAVNQFLGCIDAQFGIAIQDPTTRDYLRSLHDKELKPRQSANFGESGAGVAWDGVHEGYMSSSDSLNLSLGFSEQMEDKFGAEHFALAREYTALGQIWDEEKGRRICAPFYLRPRFWPSPMDTYQLMQLVRYKPDRRKERVDEYERSSRRNLEWKILKALGAIDYSHEPVERNVKEQIEDLIDQRKNILPIPARNAV